jgi:hypothetical protein
MREIYTRGFGFELLPEHADVHVGRLGRLHLLNVGDRRFGTCAL